MRLIEEILTRLAAMRKGDPIEMVYAKFDEDKRSHQYVRDFTYLADFMLDSREITEEILVSLNFVSITPGRWVNGNIVVNMYADGSVPEVRVDKPDAFIDIKTVAPLNLLTLILGDN